MSLPIRPADNRPAGRAPRVHSRTGSLLSREPSSLVRYLAGVSPNDTPGIAFATLIRDARRRAGMTQEQLVYESGVSRATIKRWEGGDVGFPRPDQVRSVCHVLGIDPREAAIALGYITREEAGLPPIPPPPQYTPTEAEILEILRDPRVPHELKLEWRDYLRWQHQRNAKGARGRGA